MQGTYNRTPGVKRLQKGYKLPIALTISLKDFCAFSTQRRGRLMTQTEVVETALDQYCKRQLAPVTAPPVRVERMKKFFELPTHLLDAIERRRLGERAYCGRNVAAWEIVQRALEALLHRPCALSEDQLRDLEERMLPDILGSKESNAERIKELRRKLDDKRGMEYPHGHEALREYNFRVNGALRLAQMAVAATAQKVAMTRVRKPFTLHIDVYRALRERCNYERTVLKQPSNQADVIERALRAYFAANPVWSSSQAPDGVGTAKRPRSAESLKWSIDHVTRTLIFPGALVADIQHRCALERKRWATLVTHNDILERALKTYLHKPGGTQPASRSDSPVDAPSTQNN